MPPNDRRHFFFQTVALPSGHGRHQFLIKNGNTGSPSIAGSLYAAHLAGIYDSPNTVDASLTGIRALLSFGLDQNIDIESPLLRGQCIEPKVIRAFAYWLQKGSNEAASNSEKRTFNALLLHARAAETWFVSMYWAATGGNVRAHSVQMALTAQKSVWDGVKKRVHATPIAPDLAEEEIARIDTYLASAALGRDAGHLWVRSFLIWRLAIEFGMRIGEILALRVQDCPHLQRRTFEIVRCEDRRDIDPRGINAPRPKTLGRSLGILLPNSAFPDLALRYISEYRVTWKVRPDGSKRKSPYVPHPYLIVNDEGSPLPPPTAAGIAARIGKETGVTFNWHLARHAFFNRSYAAIGEIDDPGEQNVRLNDLVYWGGWSDPKSMEIYTNRARRHRAERALSIWQGQQEPWTSLT